MTREALVPSPALVIMAALMLSAPAANAIPMTFTADLSGANELPNPVPSPPVFPGFPQVGTSGTYSPQSSISRSL